MFINQEVSSTNTLQFRIFHLKHDGKPYQKVALKRSQENAPVSNIYMECGAETHG